MAVTMALHVHVAVVVVVRQELAAAVAGVVRVASSAQSRQCVCAWRAGQLPD